jgi:hypothetical protein
MRAVTVSFSRTQATGEPLSRAEALDQEANAAHNALVSRRTQNGREGGQRS